MKRPAASDSGHVAKMSKIKQIVDAMTSSEALAKDAMEAFSKTLPFALGEFKELRHPYQSEIVSMAGEAMVTIENALALSTSAAETKSAELMNAAVEKGRRVSLQDAAESEVCTLEAALQVKKDAMAAASWSMKEAAAALKTAKAEAAQADYASQQAENAKVRVKSGLDLCFRCEGLGNLKQQSAGATPTAKQALKELISLSSTYGFDRGMQGSAATACKKAPTERTEFELYALEQMDTALTKQLEMLETSASNALTECSEKAKATDEMEKALTNAKELVNATEKEAAEAQASLKEGQKKLAAAKKYVDQYWSDAEAACNASDEAAGVLNHFKGILAEFSTLKDLETPPPPEEPQVPEVPDVVEPAADAEMAAAVA